MKRLYVVVHILIRAFDDDSQRERQKRKGRGIIMPSRNAKRDAKGEAETKSKNRQQNER